jgi:hypothetical protein
MLGKFSRRDFAKLAGFSAVGNGGGAPRDRRRARLSRGTTRLPQLVFKNHGLRRSCTPFPVAPQRARPRTDKLYAKAFQFAPDKQIVESFSVVEWPPLARSGRHNRYEMRNTIDGRRPPRVPQ